MTIRVVPPVPIVDRPAPRLRRVVPVAVPSGAYVGIVDNGKAMAEEIMVSAARALRDGQGVEVQKKPSAGKVMTLERRAELLARAHMVISGVGD